MNPNLVMSIEMGLFGAFTTWVLVALLIRFVPRIGLVDRPNKRSLHSRVTPRGGGIAIVAVALSFLGVFVIWVCSGAAQRIPWRIYLSTALFIAVVSLWDDFRSLGAGLRIVCHVAAAAFVARFLAHFEVVTMPGVNVDLPAWLGIAFTMVWIVGLTNDYNFMDGIDGIAAMQGIVAGLAWAVAGAWIGSGVILSFAFVLTGGCFGFLLHNWAPARIFMGDVGSAFLGFTFGVLPLLLLRELPSVATAMQPGIVPGFAVLVVWPFVGDGLLTFCRRVYRGERAWQPHRSHLYQRLVQTGWSHARVSLLNGGWCVVSTLAGLWWLRQASGATLVALATPLLTLAGMYGLVSWRERKVRRSCVLQDPTDRAAEGITTGGPERLVDKSLHRN